MPVYEEDENEEESEVLWVRYLNAKVNLERKYFRSIRYRPGVQCSVQSCSMQPAEPPVGRRGYTYSPIIHF